jgi:DNA segregation ATPase FtsK/SpoIIIE-like protein
MVLEGFLVLRLFSRHTLTQLQQWLTLPLLTVLAWTLWLGYTPSDPSFFVHRNAVAQHPLGTLGAWLIAWPRVALGHSSWIIPLMLTLWSLLRFLPCHASYKPPTLLGRSLALIVLVTAVAVVGAWIGRWWGRPFWLGGLWGQMLWSQWIYQTGALPAATPILVASLIALGLASFSYAGGSQCMRGLFQGWRRIGGSSRYQPLGQSNQNEAEDKSLDELQPRASRPRRTRPRVTALHLASELALGHEDGIEAKDESHDMPKEKTAKNDASQETVAPPKTRKPRPSSDGVWEVPPPDLLRLPPKRATHLSSESLNHSTTQLLQVLNDYGIEGAILNVRAGPVVILYEFEPAPGIKSSRVIGLADDISRSMSAMAVRIAVVPGRNVIGIELPHPERQTVYLRELLEHGSFHQPDLALPIALGKTIAGDPVVVDLARMPHLLVAGTTGSGKSVAINTMILSLLSRLRPDHCKFIMIDPKMLELSVYDGIPHLLTPVVTDPSKAVVALKWVVREMENRYRLMSTLGVRNITSYNRKIEDARERGNTLTREVQTGFDPETGRPLLETVPLDMEPLPFIVVIVDEMADLMLVAGKDIETSIQRLAQMARAAGIHIIMATQRPSVDVITGVIKANFPTRISFQVTSRIDSRTILGEQGAEQLLGMGDMLYMGGGGKITRVHGPFVSDQEVEEVVRFLKSQAAPVYIDAIQEDEGNWAGGGGVAGASEEGGSEDDRLYDRALHLVVTDRKASTSYIQRSLRIGYNRAAILMERLEREGVISAPNHAGKREILLQGREH